MGESVKAFVVLNQTGPLVKASNDAKENTVTRNLEVEFVDALPKAPTGKNTERELREKHS